MQLSSIESFTYSYYLQSHDEMGDYGSLERYKFSQVFCVAQTLGIWLNVQFVDEK